MKFFDALVNLFVSDTYRVTDRDLYNWAKTEYRNDPEYAMLQFRMTGKMPEAGW